MKWTRRPSEQECRDQRPVPTETLLLDCESVLHLTEKGLTWTLMPLIYIPWLAAVFHVETALDLIFSWLWRVIVWFCCWLKTRRVLILIKFACQWKGLMHWPYFTCYQEGPDCRVITTHTWQVSSPDHVMCIQYEGNILNFSQLLMISLQWPLTAENANQWHSWNDTRINQLKHIYVDKEMICKIKI